MQGGVCKKNKEVYKPFYTYWWVSSVTLVKHRCKTICKTATRDFLGFQRETKSLKGKRKTNIKHAVVSCIVLVSTKQTGKRIFKHSAY